MIASLPENPTVPFYARLASAFHSENNAGEEIHDKYCFRAGEPDKVADLFGKFVDLTQRQTADPSHTDMAGFRVKSVRETRASMCVLDGWYYHSICMHVMAIALTRVEKHGDCSTLRLE